MAQITTSTHPLVALRAACDFTREQLAAIAGTTAASVQNFELGRAPVPIDVVQRIEAATGCRAASLVKAGSRPQSLGGQPFTRARYQSWLAASNDAAKNIEEETEEIAFRIKMILAAAGDRYLYVVRRLDHFLEAIKQDSEISNAALLVEERKNAPVETLASVTIDELKRLIVPTALPTLSEWLDKNPQKSNSACKVTTEKFRHSLPAAAVHKALLEKEWRDEEGLVYGVKAVRTLYRIEFADGKRLEISADVYDARTIGRSQSAEDRGRG